MPPFVNCRLAYNSHSDVAHRKDMQVAAQKATDWQEGLKKGYGGDAEEKLMQQAQADDSSSSSL